MNEEQKTELREAITELVKYTFVMGIVHHSGTEWFMDGQIYTYDDIRRIQSEWSTKVNELIERGA